MYKDTIKKKFDKMSAYVNKYKTLGDSADNDFALEVANFTESLSDIDMIAFDYYGYDIDEFLSVYEAMLDKVEKIIEEIEKKYQEIE